MAFVAAATSRILASNSHKFPAQHLEFVCAFVVISCILGALICYSIDIEGFPPQLKSATLFVLIGTAIILPAGVMFMQAYKREKK